MSVPFSFSIFFVNMMINYTISVWLFLFDTVTLSLDLLYYIFYTFIHSCELPQM